MSTARNQQKILFRQMAEHTAREHAHGSFNEGWRYDDDHPDVLLRHAQRLAEEYAEKFAMHQPDREQGDRRTFQWEYFDTYEDTYIEEMKRLSAQEEEYP